MNDILVPDRLGPLVSDEQVPWRETIRIVSRHWFVFGLVLVVGLAVAGAIVLSRPPVYKATARLVVQPNVAHEPFSSRDNSGGLVARYADSRGAEAEINASVAMLESRALIRHVLESGSLKRSSSGRQRAEPGAVARALEALRGLPKTWYERIHTPPVVNPMDLRVNGALKALSVRALDESYVIEVAYRSRDPVWATDFVNGLVKEYLRPDSVLQGGEDRFGFFHEQRALVEQRLDTARGALRAFRTRDEADLAFEDPTELRSHRGQIQARKDETIAELAGVDARLVSLAREITGLSASLNVDPQLENIAAVDRVAGRVTELELQRSELLSRYAVTSAVVRDLDAQLARAREMLASETASANAALARSGNAAQQLALARVQARVERSLLVGTLAALDAEIAAYTEKLDRLDNVAAERQRLEHELALAEEAYTTYRKKEEEARFTDALRRAGIRNQTVIEHAVVPSVPEPAGAGRMMLLGAVLSMLLALGLIRGIDRLDSSVKAVAEAEMLAGATVIGLVALDDSPDARAIEPASRLGKLLHHPARSIAAFSVLAVLFGAYVQAVGRSAAREDLRPGQVKQAARRSTWSPVRADGDAGARAAGSPVEIVPAAEAVHEVAIDSVVADPMAAEDMATGEASAVTPDAIEAKPIEIQNTVVVIEQGATMYSLLRHFYGAYSAEHLERVRSANPWLQDPAHIPAGLTLHLPATGDGDGPGNVSIPRQP